jgi:hypothetical protein
MPICLTYATPLVLSIFLGHGTLEIDSQDSLFDLLPCELVLYQRRPRHTEASLTLAHVTKFHKGVRAILVGQKSAMGEPSL